VRLIWALEMKAESTEKNKDKDIYRADLNRLFKEKGFVLFLD